MASTINASNSGFGGIVSTGDSSGQLQLQTANTTAVTIDASQNVGIGTSSPTQRLQVDSTSATSTVFSRNGGTNANTNVQFKNSTTSFYLGTNTSGNFAIKYNDPDLATSPNMVIDSSGNVGIGTTSPFSAAGYKSLTINGSTTGILAIQANGSNSCYLYSDGSAFNIKGVQNIPMDFYTNDTQRMRIDSNGNISAIGIYNTTTAGAVNVNVRNDGFLLRSTSALKYKTDVRDLPSIDINKFRPVVYKSKCEGDDQTIDHFGIIADEVEAAGIKELVSYNAEGEVEGFQYERLTAVLVKAIQEQQTIINDLKARIETLESK